MRRPTYLLVLGLVGGAHLAAILAALALWRGDLGASASGTGRPSDSVASSATEPLPERWKDVHWTDPNTFLASLGGLGAARGTSPTPSKIALPGLTVPLPPSVGGSSLPQPQPAPRRPPARTPVFDAPPLPEPEPDPQPRGSEQPIEPAEGPPLPKAPPAGSLPPSLGGELFGPGDAAKADPEEDYERLLQETFLGSWAQPRSGSVHTEATATTLSVTIRRDGSLESYSILSPSGSPVMDGSVLDAARRIGRVAPIPSSIRGKSYRAMLRFRLD